MEGTIDLEVKKVLTAEGGGQYYKISSFAIINGLIGMYPCTVVSIGGKQGQLKRCF